MKKFLVLYKASTEAQKKWQTMSPEDHKAGMAKWFAWKEQVGDVLVDFGSPLKHGDETTPLLTAVSSLNDKIIGYSFIQAEDLAAANEVIKTHPHLADDGHSIIVHEIMPMPEQ